MSIVKKYMMRTLNSVCASDKLEDVIEVMHRTEMSVLPVVSYENEFLGTIYGKNILRNIIPEEYGFLESHRLLYEVNQAAENLDEIKDKKVKEYMSTNTVPIKEMSKMDNLADIMLHNDESYLFVINEDNKLRGYISRADLLCYLLDVGEDRR
ncbi:CBS-domain-containing membrane protein [Halobacteroides halobius DSM 5150]|uniref:CBS-domain-containing membrane protein n=1 Tax=Halobacteroides halobius (strain ATCC 35273 / DSM 5150 / MD-1) TaxID=748449 RepID=L0K6T0_HALHC|nr:CBS domain-containing protein [Halobacteroides halobius]AGB40731.1 CBS-domain-containing membrane protein [Halobacteroides halobius DSM 5150]